MDLLKQDNPEHDTPPQTNDEKQKHEQHELGTQKDEIYVLPQTQEDLNNMDLHKDEMMDFVNVCGNDVEHPWSPCLNFDELFDLNVFDDGPHENPGESESLFIDEPLYEAFELNQHGIMDGDFMQYKASDQCYDLNKDITPGKEYRTGDEANDLVVEEAKGKEDAFFMLNDKGCNDHEASELVKEQRTKNDAFQSSPSPSTTSEIN